MTTALAAREQVEALADMGPELKAVCSKIQQLIRRLLCDEVMARYEIGEQIREATQNERKYGAEAVSKLAKALGNVMSPEQLYQCRQLCNTYSRKDIEALLKTRFVNGGQFTWSHLCALASIKGHNCDKIRQDLQKEIVALGISSHQLGAEIVRRTGGVKRSQGGRKPLPPRSIPGGLHQIARYQMEIDNRMDGWEAAIFHKLENAGPDEIDEDLIDQISKTIESQKELEQSIKHVVIRLEKGLYRAQKIQEKRDEAEEEPEEDEPRPLRRKRSLQPV